jgi:hypothetical protein
MEHTNHSSSSDPTPRDDAFFEESSRAFREACRKGSQDARRAFEDALPKLKHECLQGVHDVAYALAYAATFGATVLQEITPDLVKSGFREGREAGRTAAQRATERSRAARTTPASPEEGLEGYC